MNNTDYSIFYPITKVDNEQRMVWGLASTPEMDSQGDIIPIEAIKNALPEYLKYPTIREMHQPIAAGKTIYTDISDEGLRIGAKIVDDNAWKKVKEGVYAGFSVGGSIIERDGDIIKALDLAEISLVDSPANKGARIELFKADRTKVKVKNKVKNIDELRKGFALADTLADIGHNLEALQAYCERQGVDTTPLDNALAELKPFMGTLVNYEEDDEDIDSTFYMMRQDTIAKINTMLHALVGVGVHPDKVKSLVKEVTTKMANEKELKKLDEEKAETTEVVETPEAPAETPEVSETPSEGKTETPTEEAEETTSEDAVETPKETEGTAETVAASAKSDDLVKILAAIEGMRKSLKPDPEKEVFAKAEFVKALEVRIAKLENTVISKVKSPAYPVEKGLENNASSGSAELDTVNKRLDELLSIKKADVIKYQTSGYQEEANELLNKKAALEAK